MICGPWPQSNIQGNCSHTASEILLINHSFFHTMKTRDADSSKKRRLPRACDNCKRKKIKCDSEEMPGKRCSNCITYNVQCKHIEALNSFGTARGYVQKLESRVQKLEAVFKKLLPDVDIENEIAAAEVEAAFSDPKRSRFDDPVAEISRSVSQILVIPPGKRFFGKSSGLHIVPMVIEAKARYLRSRGEPCPSTVQIKKREEFWNFQPWSGFPVDDPTGYEYPPDDLMSSLVDLYFRNQNACLPLLHRPTFEKEMKALSYLYDRQFGATLLLVCAHGSRHSDDERVFVEGNGEAGWKWLFQAISTRNGFEGRDLTTLYELQIHALSASYLQTVGRWETVWTQLGFAFRRAQDIGAHLRRGSPPNAQDELWKRAFWVLYCIDVSMACRYGRPVSMMYEDIDVDFPIECDDEYWDHEDPQQNFVQPPNKPSEISYFISLLKLMEIAAYVKRFIYSSRKSMILGGYRRPSEQELLSSFDAALNQWCREIPTHLKWDPNETNYTFFIQSGFLHIVFHYIRILVHRPYVVGLVDDPIQLAQSMSATACMQAAHACLDVVAGLKRVDYIMNLPTVSTVGAVTLTLLLIMYGKGKPTTTDVRHVSTALGMLKSMEKSIPSAGAFWDLLSHLTLGESYQHNMRQQEVIPPPSLRKRAYEAPVADDTVSSSSSLSQDINLPGPCIPVNSNFSSEVLDFYRGHSFATPSDEGDLFNQTYTPLISQPVYHESIPASGIPSFDYFATQPFLSVSGSSWPHIDIPDRTPDSYLDLHRSSHMRHHID